MDLDEYKTALEVANKRIQELETALRTAQVKLLESAIPFDDACMVIKYVLIENVKIDE
jgi:hypothetical protein